MEDICIAFSLLIFLFSIVCDMSILLNGQYHVVLVIVLMVVMVLKGCFIACVALGLMVFFCAD